MEPRADRQVVSWESLENFDDISVVYKTGFLIFHGKKKQTFAGFSGANSWKNRQFRGIFAGKKSKFVKKSADFVGFSLEKSQNSQKNRPTSREFSRKKSNFEGFSGANS